MTRIPIANNEWADFWRNQIGVNVIPANTREKKTWINWSEYQNEPIRESQHEQWKKVDAFSEGIAIIVGKVWHNKFRKDLYLNFIDLDNLTAIREFCTRNGVTTPLEELAKHLLVEQHPDDSHRAHVFCYSTKPFKKKSSSRTNHNFSGKIDANEIPAFEVKGLGEHGIAFVTPSPHKNGRNYEIIGTLEPEIADDLDQHVDSICTKYGIPYLESTKDKIPIEDLFKEDTRIVEGQNRHEAVLRIMESLLIRNRPILPAVKIKQLAWEENRRICVPALDSSEFERQWNDAVNFVRKKSRSVTSCGSQMKTDFDPLSDKIVYLTEYMLQKYTFVTMKDTNEVFYYERGRYIRNGEVEIKIKLEEYDKSIRINTVKEVIEKIRRSTYKNRYDFDVDINILNFKNGLVNILTGEFTKHSPDYLSLVQLPLNYDPKAKCPNIRSFLDQVTRPYPKNIFTIIQFLGFCLYRSARYSKALMCLGVGDNGKSVFLQIVESFLGIRNVSHSSLHELATDRFATADLYGKFANIFADLKSGKLTETSIFKMLVSGDEIRAQRKHGQPFDFRNYAKLIFSTNQIPEVNDRSYAYFKRWIILRFENVFDNNNSDPNIIEKLTTESELSGLLNLALIGLKKLMVDGRFVNAGDVYETEKMYVSATNSVKDFVETNCIIDGASVVGIVCKKLYDTYENYCKIRKITPLHVNSFGANLICMGIKKERQMLNGQREYVYLGISLKSEILSSIMNKS